MQTRLVVLERAAGELRPLHRVLTLLDPLLRRAAAIVELDDVSRLLREIGDNEPHTGKQLPRVPFDLGNDAPGSLPRLGLITKAVVEDLRLVRGAAWRAGEQMLDFPFQHGVGLDADSVLVALVFQQPQQLRQGEGRIAPEELGNLQVAVALDDRQQHPPPELRAGVVPTTQHGKLQVTDGDGSGAVDAGDYVGVVNLGGEGLPPVQQVALVLPGRAGPGHNFDPIQVTDRYGADMLVPAGKYDLWILNADGSREMLEEDLEVEAGVRLQLD